MINSERKMYQSEKQKQKPNESGFSVIELLVVVSVVIILSVMAVMSFSSDKLYKADTQAFNIIDVFQEARQRSLADRVTMRVEISETNQQIRIINEGRIALDATDDTVIKTLNFVQDGVFVGTTATNQTGAPAELSPTPGLTFATSLHPLSTGETVATLRFTRDGTVRNAGNDAGATGAVPIGATVFVWSKYTSDTSTQPDTGQIFRAVTVLRSSGLTRLWTCTVTNGQCSTWKKK